MDLSDVLAQHVPVTRGGDYGGWVHCSCGDGRAYQLGKDWTDHVGFFVKIFRKKEREMKEQQEMDTAKENTELLRQIAYELRTANMLSYLDSDKYSDVIEQRLRGEGR